MSSPSVQNALLSVLLSYPAMAIAILLLVALPTLLIGRRRQLSPAVKAGLTVLLVLVVLYLLLILCLVIGFGSNGSPPTPTSI